MKKGTFVWSELHGWVLGLLVVVVVLAVIFISSRDFNLNFLRQIG